MAGHSHWAGIKHKKGKADKARSNLFSKLSREITVAAKLGDKNPDMNARLRSSAEHLPIWLLRLLVKSNILAHQRTSGHLESCFTPFFVVNSLLGAKMIKNCTQTSVNKI